MSEDATKETAATSEPPVGRRGRLRLASQEFFFLLQRIDRLDEKLTGEVKTIAGELKAMEERVNARIDRLDEKKPDAVDGRNTDYDSSRICCSFAPLTNRDSPPFFGRGFFCGG